MLDDLLLAKLAAVESRFEELNLIEAGANYQWNYREGNQPSGPRPAKVRGNERGPLHLIPHQGVSAVIGGVVYRGRANPALVGKYLFADKKAQRCAPAPQGASPDRYPPPLA